MTPSTPCNCITAIILASGKGTRFGLPKAEAGWDGKSFLERVSHSLKLAGIDKIYTARHFESPDMLATLRLAVEDLQQSASGNPPIAYLVFPVDFPFVQPDTIVALLKAQQDYPQAIIRPCYQQRCGHPIIIPAALDLQTDDLQQGLKGIIRQSKLSVIDIPVDDSGILRNINTAKDLS